MMPKSSKIPFSAVIIVSPLQGTSPEDGFFSTTVTKDFVVFVYGVQEQLQGYQLRINTNQLSLQGYLRWSAECYCYQRCSPIH